MVAIASSAFLVYDTGSPSAADASAAAGDRVHAAPPAAAAATTTPEPTTTTVPPASQVDLGAGLPEAEAAAGDTVDLGVAILDLRTGELVGNGGDKQFYSGSLSKLLLVVDMLDRRAEDGLELSDDDLDLVDRALSY